MLQMIPVAQAMNIAGHTNRKAFDQMIKRINDSNPEEPVIRTRGRVDIHSLQKGLRNYARASMQRRRDSQKKI